jgi:uncharacterized RDD family membrane protein YckC
VMIRFCVYTAVSIPLAFLSKSGVGLYLIVLFLGEWFYPVFFEVTSGATPGKKQFGLQVVHDNGTPVSGSASVIRNLLRVADFLPVGYAAGLVCMLVQRDFKRLGDLAAGTIVVYRDDFQLLSRPAEGEAVRPSAPLSLDEQRAVVEFAERLEEWTPQRAAELASLALPLTGKSGRDGVTALVGMANWLVGRRA